MSLGSRLSLRHCKKTLFQNLLAIGVQNSFNIECLFQHSKSVGNSLTFFLSLSSIKTLDVTVETTTKSRCLLTERYCLLFNWLVFSYSVPRLHSSCCPPHLSCPPRQSRGREALRSPGGGPAVRPAPPGSRREGVSGPASCFRQHWPSSLASLAARHPQPCNQINQ